MYAYIKGLTGIIYEIMCCIGLDEEIKQEELGPNRHSAEFRIKKSQVSMYTYTYT